jgi:hypothetical protein
MDLLDQERKSGAYCPRCDYRFTLWEATGLLAPIWSCPVCALDWRRLEVNFKQDALPLVEDDAARASTWFHATQRKGWLESAVSNDFPVHVGSEAAAIIRAIHTRHEVEGSTWWIYEMSVAKNTQIQSGVRDDAEHDWIGDLDDFEVEAGHGIDALRYLNRWEDTGSISLLIDPNFLQTVQVRTYDLRGLDRRLHQLFD